MVRAAENEEDKGDVGVADLSAYDIKPEDTIVGVSAAGNADYVVQALLYAKSVGCVTIGLTSNEDSLVAHTADIPIVTDTGAEVVTGSTRMKAGTAQKLVLNMLSTTAMIKMGNVYENLMINLKAKNIKLMQRMKRIVEEISGCSEEEAERLLEKNDWNIRSALEDYNGR